MAKKHDEVAKRIATRLGSEYNSGKGADINAQLAAVEVETVNTVKGGLTQLQGHKKPAYIAGADEETVQKALEKTDGTTIGVMDQHGNIVKPSTRRA